LEIISVRHELQTAPNAPLFFRAQRLCVIYFDKRIEINARKEGISSQRPYAWRWKGNISRGAKIPHDPWKTFSKTFRFV